MYSAARYTAFEGRQLIAKGTLEEVVLKIKKRLGKNAHQSTALIFSDSTGKVIDFNFHGSEKEILKRLQLFVSDDIPKESAGPGRPKLGVVSREISLLPRHWEWLAGQPGGASATLRKLVEDAKKRCAGGSAVKQSQQRSHKFMSGLAGDLAGYEEALRALYKKDREVFLSAINGWPTDIREHVIELAKDVFSG